MVTQAGTIDKSHVRAYFCRHGSIFSYQTEEDRTMDNQDTPLTISVPEAGKRYFGLSRNAAYDAAARGDIPTIKVGRLKRVPVRAMERMLDRLSEAEG
jgi:hypothetical protein